MEQNKDDDQIDRERVRQVMRLIDEGIADLLLVEVGGQETKRWYQVPGAPGVVCITQYGDGMVL